MLTAAELKGKATRKYHAILGQVILGENPFPLGIPYKQLRRTGNPAELLKLKEILRGESKATNGHGPTIEFLPVKTRRFADGTLPGKIEFTSLPDLTRYIGKGVEAERILRHAELVSKRLPGTTAWTAKHTEKLADENSAFWNDICLVVEYFRDHPKPWVYVRELPLGLQTKFVEKNYRVIVELVEVIAPNALNEPYTSWQDRLGLRSGSSLIEGRFLDPKLAPTLPQHFQAPVTEWNNCEFKAPSVVLVTENRTTFLTLPSIPGCLALLGKGYAVTRLAEIKKLSAASVFYWGDIDQHGFEILASFRSKLSHVQSLLMDSATTEQFRSLATTETVEATLQPAFVSEHLTNDERGVWEKCANNHFRLEQEHLPFLHTTTALKVALTKSNSTK
jgi:hypothetical protein